MKKRKLKTKSLEEVIDKYIGKRGRKKREIFEHKLSSELFTEEQILEAGKSAEMENKNETSNN